jgi:hypothetical protein
MQLFKKLSEKLLYMYYKLFPNKFTTSAKGECVADYCRIILEEDLPPEKRIQAYEDFISDIQKKTNASRTMAVIYILSVLSEVQQK